MEEVPRFTGLLRSLLPTGLGEWTGPVDVTKETAERVARGRPPSLTADRSEQDSTESFAAFSIKGGENAPSPGFAPLEIRRSANIRVVV
jgi:hypothetical protein